MPGVIVELHDFAGDILIDSEDEVEASEVPMKAMKPLKLISEDEVEASEVPMKLMKPLKLNPLWVREERIETFERSEFESDLNNDSNLPKKWDEVVLHVSMVIWESFWFPIVSLFGKFVSHKEKT